MCTHWDLHLSSSTATLPLLKAAPSSVRETSVDPPPGLDVDGLRHAEYLLRKYGKQREALSESTQIDDTYCTFSFSLTKTEMLTSGPAIQSHITPRAV